jgi:hypothetical protein
MAKLLGCRICMIELARIELADGSVALICHACEVIGVEHEVARGGPMWAGEAAKARARAAPAPERRAADGFQQGYRK